MNRLRTRPPKPRPRRRTLVCGLVAVLILSVSPCLRGDLHATCRCGKGELEIVFVVDATSSMWPVIGTIKAQAERIVQILEGHIEKLRVGAVAFRTRNDRDMPEPRVLALTSERARLAKWFASLHASGGGEEAVADGLEAALKRMKWSPRARKVIVLIGDEGPLLEPGLPLSEARTSKHIGPEGRRLLDLAAEARARGIVLNTVTASRTAWLYYMNWLRNVDVAAAERVVDRYGTVEELPVSFRLPVFEAAAELAGGRAVGSGDTREIVKRLLAFGLGGDGDSTPLEIPPPRATPGRREFDTAARGRSRIGRVRYRGEWRTPRSFEGLVRHLASVVRIDLDETPAEVSLADKELWRLPLLYLSGHGPVKLTPAERAGLKAYVESGGVLWADCCCGRPEFERTLRAELARVFPGSRLERLPASHPLFEIGHVINEVRVASAHRKLPYRKAAPHVEALLAGRGPDRERPGIVLYTPHSLGAGWKTHGFGLPCMMHDDDALRMSEHIVLFAMSR